AFFPAHKLLMRAAFMHYAILQHHDFAGVANGSQSVRYHYTGASDHQLIKGFLNELFTLAVETACSFIQYEYRGVFKYSPCNSDTLALPAGQLNAPFAHQGVEFVGK